MSIRLTLTYAKTAMTAVAAKRTTSPQHHVLEGNTFLSSADLLDFGGSLFSGSGLGSLISEGAKKMHIHYSVAIILLCTSFSALSYACKKQFQETSFTMAHLRTSISTRNDFAAF